MVGKIKRNAINRVFCVKYLNDKIFKYLEIQEYNEVLNLNKELVEKRLLHYTYANDNNDCEKIKINLSTYLGCMSEKAQKFLWDCLFTKNGIYKIFSPRHLLYYLIVYHKHEDNQLNNILILEYRNQIKENEVYDPSLIIDALFESSEDRITFYNAKMFKILNNHFKNCIKLKLLQKKNYLDFLNKSKEQTLAVLYFPNAFFDEDEYFQCEIVIILIKLELQRLFT
tara:strand:- start:3250 stop:3927 length:678 start_codon:yes stop_codon:yes gene_type:complete